MNNNSVVAQTVSQTLLQLTPAILAASLSASTGGNALLAANMLAELMKAVTNYHAVGQMTSVELIAYVASLSKSLQSTDDAIAALPGGPVLPIVASAPAVSVEVSQAPMPDVPVSIQ